MSKTAQNRIAARFAELKNQNRKGLVTFITAGDPDAATSQAILNDLPHWGADIIELGMPFSDPMADGPAIQDAGGRALKAGADMKQTLAMAKAFRAKHDKTPLILMGYYNPIYSYGVEKFAKDAATAGADGLIIVDLPPEEDAELREPAQKAGLDIIRLVTPTTDDKRLEVILDGAGGFIYVVAIAGVTGTASANADALKPLLERLRKRTKLPVAVGFGINTPADARAMAVHADAVVVGSAIVRTIGALQNGDKDKLSLQIKDLSKSVRG